MDELREALTAAFVARLKRGDASPRTAANKKVVADLVDVAFAVIAPALAEARAAERERCAKVAEDYEGRGIDPGDGYHAQLGDASLTRREIATTIRALSPHPGI